MDFEVEEGYAITLENGQEYLLIERTEEGFLAVGLDEDTPNDKYYKFKEYEEDGEYYMEIVDEFAVE